jgi:hypothetical protein
MLGTRHRDNPPERVAAAALERGRVGRIARLGIRALRSRPRRGAGAALLLLAVLAGIGYLVWPASDHGSQSTSPARWYTDYTACLLTDSTGITGSAAPVWAGMQAASRTTREQVTFLTLRGADTAANADTYINTLVLRGCGIILSAGALPDRGVADRAAAFPKLRFVTIADPATVGASGVPTPTAVSANVTVIAPRAPAATSAAVQAALLQADPS